MVVVGVFAAALVISLVSRWWVDGFVNGTEALALGVILGGLVFGLFAVGSLGARALVLGILLALTAWALYLHARDSARSYYRERIRLHEQAIAADPTNVAARSALAQSYYRLGDLDSAIAAMELAVQVSPNALKEAYLLSHWTEERQLRDSKTVVCPLCHSANLWGTLQCRTCRQPIAYPSPGLLSRLAERGQWAGYLAVGLAWAAATGTAFLIARPVQAAVVGVCGALAASGWLLLASSARERRGPTKR